uniref:Merozoite surface antigen 2a1 n=1 Tax=Babesia orientalis TaxID=273649 RepID=A0A7S8BTC9_9APIC|nr:Merozoite surface antigen 2a1 [Babesia orientalis]
MMGAKLAIAALCCLASYSVATTPVKKGDRLFDDMKLYYDTMNDITDDKMKKLVEAKYKAADLGYYAVKEAVGALDKVKRDINDTKVFVGANFNEKNSDYPTNNNDDEKFSNFVDAIITMKAKLDDLNKNYSTYMSFADPMPSSFKKYFEEKVYDKKIDMTITDNITNIKNFLDKFLTKESAFEKLVKHTKAFKEKNTQRSEKNKVTDPGSVQDTTAEPAPLPADSVERDEGPASTCTHEGSVHNDSCPNPTGDAGSVHSENEASASSVPADTATSSQEKQNPDVKQIDKPTPETGSSVPGSSSASSTSSAAPQPVDTTSGPQGQAGSPQAPSEGVSGNLKGQQDTQQNNTASSATFTGLSVATVCYIVLSAF